MRPVHGMVVLGALWVPVFIACGSSKSSLPGDNGDDASTGSGDDSSSSSSGSSGGSGSSSGGIHFDPGEAGVMTAPSDCKAGYYSGDFTGSYSSSLIFGIPLAVSGNVDLTLDQAPGGSMMCMIEGEGFETCSNVFNLSGGTITGVANKAGMIGDATIGGYPYYCTLTGTLDCATKQLVNGWIQCTYCLGPLADGGASCTIGIGGHFAGPLTAGYDTGTKAFTGGVWNGAESLAGNNGMMPGPEGGPISDYLVADGGYGIGVYGGAGSWGATLVP